MPGIAIRTSAGSIDCVSADIELANRSTALAIATGAIYGTASPPNRAGCDVRVDGVARPISATPGDLASTTSSGATDGFARTLVTPDALPAGTHKVSLACSELSGDVRIATPTIAAFAISTGK